MDDDIKKLSSKLFKRFFLWASEDTLKGFVVLIIIVVIGIPLIQYLQQLVIKIPYTSIFNSIGIFLKANLGLKDYLGLAALVFFTGMLLYLKDRLDKFGQISDKFDDGGLSKWSIPMYSNWTIQKCEDAPGKMLRISNSELPGTLKGANSWFDYRITFSAMINKKVEKSEDGQNIGIIIRSENNLNGILLNFTKYYFKPQVLYNGFYYYDREQEQRLPTIINGDEWIKFKILVKGNNVDISFDDFNLNYHIPTKDYNIQNYLLSDFEYTLSRLEESNKLIQDFQSKSREKINKYMSIPESDKVNRENAWKDFLDYQKTIPAYTHVILEYQKGSVGIRQKGIEKVFFRNFVISKV